ncbi:unnamed protein product [Eruca vesicaria subsp. sativa]|uniref:DUF7903 domain-containing protein n=1 Tax=Eruca vesicaria subsp. sativa TaxID=29727 RepID=A0ABC8JN81_ERUVS|nr:unnamed protein product [Eruca vesicaria subsp. sativa]
MVDEKYVQTTCLIYIPPHKRNLKDPVQPSPFPADSLVKKFRRNIDDLKSTSFRGNRIVYSGKHFTKWFLISSNGIEDEVPPSVELVPLSTDSYDCINGLKALALMNKDFQKESEEEERTRWLLIAEKVADGLVFAYEQANKRKEDHDISDNAKLRLVARFGKIVFYGRKAGPVVDYSLRNSRRIFSTDVPTSFIQNIKSKAIPRHEFCINGEKEKYIVKITGPNESLIVNVPWAKMDVSACTRQVFENISSLIIFTLLTSYKPFVAQAELNPESEVSNIQGLLSSAIVDLNVKGRLRWPLGTTSLEVRYGTGEIEKGVTLILKEMNTKLQEQNIERGCVLEMLRDVLGTIWEFMTFDGNLM